MTMAATAHRMMTARSGTVAAARCAIVSMERSNLIFYTGTQLCMNGELSGPFDSAVTHPAHPAHTHTANAIASLLSRVIKGFVI